ncbi:MAG: twin-arginine translocase subunit TatC [Chloroflexi bacterium]|nr:twin-arginine translocase subunit TatC [Chloroflexota bacterium]
MDNEKTLPILGHLAELRTRLLRSVIAVAITTTLSFVFGRQLFDLLTFKSEFARPVFEILSGRFHLAPVPDFTLIFTEVTEMLGTYMRVSLAAGIILAMPYLLYEFVMFVSPALTVKEKRYVYLAFPWVGLMFIFGVVFAYFILLPPAINFLLTFGSGIAEPQIKVGNYISVVTRLMLAVGLVFELPVLTTFLARIGVVSPAWLAGKRKLAIVFAFILAGIITPTFDPVNQVLVAVPLIILYELSIWLAKLAYRRRQS